MKRPSVSFNKDAVVDFLLGHCEKFVVTALGAGALWLVWGGINALRLESVQPNQLPATVQAAAAQASAHIGSAKEPPADLIPAHASLTAEIDGWRGAKPEAPRDLALLDRPLFEDLARRTQPAVLPLEDLRAVAGVAVLAVQQPAAAAGQPAARAVPYVVVTGLIPLAQQEAEFDRTFANVGFRDEKLDTPVWTDYEIERATVEGGKEEWQKLEQGAVLRLLGSLGAVPDDTQVPQEFQVPPDQDGRNRDITPLRFCGLLPKRIDEPWGADQFHPLVLDTMRQRAAAAAPVESKAAAAERPAAAGFADAGGGAGAVEPPVRPQPQPVAESPPQAVEATPPTPRMFRFIDLSVLPEKSYRYRVRLTLRNPNLGLEPHHIAEPALATAPVLAAPVSGPSPTVRTPDPVRLLAGRLTADDVKRLRLRPGMLELMVLAPSRTTGNYALRSVVTEAGGVANVDPSLNQPNDVRNMGEPITTGRVLLDVIGQQADPAALTPPRGGRPPRPTSTGPTEPLEMIFLKPDGSLEIVSAADSEPRIIRYRDTLYPPGAAGGGGQPPGQQPPGIVPVNPFQLQPPTPK